MASSERVSLDRLSRRHGIKLAPVTNVSVEQCVLAVGQVVGFDSVLSASRMNSAVVVFLDSVEKVNSIVQSGVVIQDTLTPVMPLLQPAKKVILSNVPPFIKDELLIAELSRHGKIVSQMKKIPLGCKSPLLKHVVCFRRQVYMVLKNDAEDLNVTFKFRIDGFDYVVFATSDTMKCFRCGKQDHIRSACTEKINDAERVNNEELGETAVAGTSAAVAGEDMYTDDVRVEVVETEVVEEKVNDRVTGAGILHEDVSAVVESIVTEESLDTEMMRDEALFKTPSTKRKRPRKSPKPKSTCQGIEESVNKSDDTECSTLEDSDGEAAVSRNRQDHQGVYTFGKIRSFLQKTKNMKNVQVEDFFPDRKLFIDSVTMMMRGDSEEHFTAQEVFRLKKFVSKMKLKQKTEDGFETT
ncbi:hypothetical protein M9458_052893 [Cirrhinus mrigala]|uniref:CCHC-type domain-containing protein n=1 Tax=Cirrhinus mrigala TaxID=683832 RepID=A0ABD0MP01_CIRMR